MAGELSLPVDFLTIFYLIFAIGLALIGSGLYFFYVANKIHPKTKFASIGKNGLQFREFRLFGGVIPTEYDIISLLLGKVAYGFNISRFSYDYFNNKKMYVCLYINGRIFPCPLNLGSTPLTMLKCNKCGFSGEAVKNYISDGNGDLICPKNYPKEVQKATFEIYAKNNLIRVRKLADTPPQWKAEIGEKSASKNGCEGVMVEEEFMMDKLDMHAVKFTPELEQRFIYLIQTEQERIGRVPLKELITVFDIGKEICSDMVQGIRETKEMLTANNPLMAVIFITVPVVIVLLVAALAGYINYQALATGQTVITNGLLQVSDKLLEVAKLLNKTG